MSQMKCLEDIESEVGKSLAILDRDLEDIEKDLDRSRNDFQKTKETSRPEEYHKTLEVLDNVLAEFDDWPTTEDMNLNNEDDSLELDVFLDANELNNKTNEQSAFQKTSLPVIPIRSPTTRLSESDKVLSRAFLSPPKNDCTTLDDSVSNHSSSIASQESNMSFSVVENDDERLQRLRAKFQRVRELLKKNVIKLLDSEPPSFVPPTPSTVPCNSLKERFDDYDDDSSPRSPTVEDIPNLLPTDVLMRPQFGMTYSLEEDLPPGVKEIIHRTSTPKSDVSTSSFSREFGRLSGFSSQSELEVSSIPDKVPLTSFKSLTLPNGLDRFPFYSHNETFSKWRKIPSSISINQRSIDSSKNPEEERKAKTSHSFFRKFSRKNKTGL